MHTQACAHAHLHTPTYMNAHARTRKHTNTHTHTHTHTHARARTDANHDSVLTPTEWQHLVSLLGVSNRDRRREVSLEFGTAGARRLLFACRRLGARRR